jgi:radical SAM superfamily enzyme YgiQ (UPF0313 family)
MNGASRGVAATTTRVLLIDIRAAERHYYHSLALQLLIEYARADAVIDRSCSFVVREYRPSELATDGESYALDFTAELLRLRPHIIGFSCYAWNLQACLRCAKIAKVLLKGVRVMFGGPNVSHRAYAERLLAENSAVDLIVRGEGEATFREVLRAELDGDAGRLDAIAGITYRRNGRPCSTDDRPRIADLNTVTLPYANRSYRERVPIDGQRSGVLLETYRGCYQRCSYCFWASARPQPWSLEMIAPELGAIMQDEVPRCYIVDSEFSYTPDHTVTLLRFIRDHNRRTQFMFFPRMTLLRNRDIVRLIKDVGNTEWGFGLQSINPEALRVVQRGWSQQRFEETLDILAEEGVDERVISLIIGIPGDDYGWFKKTIDYVVGRVKPKLLHVHHLQILPGTTLYDETEKHGIVYDDLPPYEVYETQTFSAEDIVRATRLNQAVGVTYHAARILTHQLLAVGGFQRPSDLFELVVEVLDAVGVVRGSYPLATPSALAHLRRILSDVVHRAAVERPGIARHARLLLDLARYETLKWLQEQRASAGATTDARELVDEVDAEEARLVRNPELILEQYDYDVSVIGETTCLDEVPRTVTHVVLPADGSECVFLPDAMVSLLLAFDGHRSATEVLRATDLGLSGMSVVQQLLAKRLLIRLAQPTDGYRTVRHIVGVDASSSARTTTSR